MTKLLTLLVAVAALITAAPASAHLVAHHAKGASLWSVERSQKQNLKHAEYVCANGAHKHKRWACHATKWLTRELNETETALHPPVVRVVASRSTYNGGGVGVALCGSSCVQCESGGNPSAVSPDGKYWGLYQFDYRTWKAHGGSPSSYGRAGAAEQTAVASRMDYDGWPNC